MTHTRKITVIVAFALPCKLPAYGCGYHLHPSVAGYKVMGDAIPLDLFAR